MRNAGSVGSDAVMQWRYMAIPGPSTGLAIPIPAGMADTEAVSPMPVSVLLTPVADDAIMLSSTNTPDVANQRLSFIVGV